MWIPVVICILVIGSSSGQQPNQVDTSKCPLGCPEGWTRFGFSDNCYRLPVQPATLDTFQNHQESCKKMDPTAYIMVVNGITEQLAGSAVSLQYAFNWIGVLTNGFMWLGGYHNGKQWIFLDGTDQSGNMMMILAEMLGSHTNNTCLSADPKTLGVWQTRPCSDKTGAAICEMPRRRICDGKFGGMLPVSGVSACNMYNLFPKMPSVPFIGQLLADSWVENALSSVGTMLSNLVKDFVGNPCATAAPPAPQCPMRCPVGWVSYSNATEEHCYKLPPPGALAPADTYWASVARCKQQDPSSNILWVNNFQELSLIQGIVRNYAKDWLVPGSNAYLWLGGYGSAGNSMSLYTRPNEGILWTLFNIPHITIANGTCMGANFMTAGNWELKPCEQRPPNGIAFCEMPKKPICGPVGETLVGDVIPSDLYPDLIKQYFPNMQTEIMPFLGQIFGTEPTQDAFDLDYANKTNNVKAVTTHITCSRPSTSGLNWALGRPDYIWLNVDGKDAVVPGQWATIKCSYGDVTVFKVQASSYLAAWSRCKNLGYVAAAPADGRWNGYYAFQAGNWLGNYIYRSGWFYGFSEKPVMAVNKC